MDKSQLAIRVKALRHKRGMSQEFLAEESGLSLRTIQRIEKGESNPTGDSLKRLANALDITADELMDWAVKEDKKYLIFLNLSALTFLFFPLLGILVPFILWSSKKDKIKDINLLGKRLINFQITWTLILCVVPMLLFVLSKLSIIGDLSLSLFFTLVGLLYLMNTVLILFNTIRISNEQSEVYMPQIQFLR
ncbi:helix-turn-helix domain-containing protein [Winogradskyella sp.]|jgi:transcriptional regulator with XRE-family HTH domain|uniref:helix-turn-helix domain-containing protein n=1 Tax=Winogradskyella sp. TaxID=1883156 RepID=UPI0025DE1F16|nr:helix-turn-helix domain-containing protein [Winogradskyella sp.]MCT4631066.1 helix-turn-helix domain-containing protein [Winogradskyella sp.]